MIRQPTDHTTAADRLSEIQQRIDEGVSLHRIEAQLDRDDFVRSSQGEAGWVRRLLKRLIAAMGRFKRLRGSNRSTSALPASPHTKEARCS